MLRSIATMALIGRVLIGIFSFDRSANAFNASTLAVPFSTTTARAIALAGGNSTSLPLDEWLSENTPPTVIVLVSVDHTGCVRDASVLPSQPEPTAAEKAIAVEHARTIRFSAVKGSRERIHAFEIPVTIFVSFGPPKER